MLNQKWNKKNICFLHQQVLIKELYIQFFFNVFFNFRNGSLDACVHKKFRYPVTARTAILLNFFSLQYFSRNEDELFIYFFFKIKKNERKNKNLNSINKAFYSKKISLQINQQNQSTVEVFCLSNQFSYSSDLFFTTVKLLINCIYLSFRREKKSITTWLI